MRLRLRDVALGLALFTLPGVADAGPDPAKIRVAADSFEAGARAYKDGRFEEAAGHFEAADMAVPSPKTLRLAMKSRAEAKQGARAASLAALALSRHGDDAETRQAAEETLSKESPALHKLEISCASPCLLAVGTRIVHGEAATRWTVYLTPGKEVLGASFLGSISAPEQKVIAKKGGQSSVRFALPAGAGSGAGGGPTGGSGAGGGTQGGTGGAGGSGAGGTGAGGSGAGGSGEGAGGDGAGGEGAGGDGAGGEGAGGDGAGDSASSGSWRIHPAPFVVSLIATAGLGATSIWSGIDTQNNPGPDAVREGCRGQGEECPLYIEGQDKETRTNALIGATAGLAALTVVFAIVTDWGGDDPEAEGAAAASLPRLWVGTGSAMSHTRRQEDQSLVLGVEGSF